MMSSEKYNCKDICESVYETLDDSDFEITEHVTSVTFLKEFNCFIIFLKKLDENLRFVKFLNSSATFCRNIILINIFLDIATSLIQIFNLVIGSNIYQTNGKQQESPYLNRITKQSIRYRCPLFTLVYNNLIICASNFIVRAFYKLIRIYTLSSFYFFYKLNPNLSSLKNIDIIRMIGLPKFLANMLTIILVLIKAYMSLFYFVDTFKQFVYTHWVLLRGYLAYIEYGPLYPIIRYIFYSKNKDSVYKMSDIHSNIHKYAYDIT